METRNYWEENGHAVKYDNYNSNDGFGRVGGDQLNFAAPSEDEAEYPPGNYLKKGKVSRQDPMSHRIIEKRRRDRMNNCLADLSRLIPPEYLKKGRGRVEKTEIIEMAIRHLKFLQDRVNAAERQAGEDHYRAGYQEAVAEAVRFLVEVQGYGPGDGLCVSMASHLQRHCDAVTKGEGVPRDKGRSHPGGGAGAGPAPGSCSETASSSSSSHGYAARAAGGAHPPPPPPFAHEPYDERPPEPYPMDCDRVSQMSVAAEGAVLTEAEVEPLPLDGRRKCEPTLRAARKPDHTEDYLHSYKFKNSIERRFSRSQDENRGAQYGAAELPRGAHGKVYSHKRRRAAKPPPAPSSSTCTSGSTSASTSGSTEDARDTPPQDTSSEGTHHHHYEKPATQYVPVFALNALGKYYVPLSVEYACLARHLGALDARAHTHAHAHAHAHAHTHAHAPLHPVTIHVNFQPCLNYHVKREPNHRDWRAV